MATGEQYQPQSFRAFLRALKWKQGEHVLISAPTGGGKTTIVRHLLEKRSHSVIFVTKMQDPTFVSDYKGWERYDEWPKRGPVSYHDKILLWPRAGKTIRETMQRQRDVFRFALDAIAAEGKRGVVVDESLMFNDPRLIGLGTEVGMMHYYGRSSGISMVDLTQRPAWIPKVIYSSVTHALVARTRDAMDLKRLSDLGGIDPKTVAANVSSLPTRHDYLYLNPQGDATPVVINSRK